MKYFSHSKVQLVAITERGQTSKRLTTDRLETRKDSKLGKQSSFLGAVGRGRQARTRPIYHRSISQIGMRLRSPASRHSKHIRVGGLVGR